MVPPADCSLPESEIKTPLVAVEEGPATPLMLIVLVPDVVMMLLWRCAPVLRPSALIATWPVTLIGPVVLFQPIFVPTIVLVAVSEPPTVNVPAKDTPEVPLQLEKTRLPLCVTVPLKETPAALGEKQLLNVNVPEVDVFQLEVLPLTPAPLPPVPDKVIFPLLLVTGEADARFIPTVPESETSPVKEMSP